MAQAEAFGEMLPERVDAERLGGVVPGGDQVDARLARERHGALGGLAGEQRVGARGGCVGDEVGAGAGHDRQAPDARRPGVEHERQAFGDRFDAREQLLGGEALVAGVVIGQGGDEADRLAVDERERSQLAVGAECAGEQRVVAEFGVRVEREVVGGQRDAGVEQELEVGA